MRVDESGVSSGVINLSKSKSSLTPNGHPDTSFDEDTEPDIVSQTTTFSKLSTQY